MSTFFSNRYLKYRRLLERGKGAPSIERDIACINCGYNLRGLKPGGVCPECGKVIPIEVYSEFDPLLAGDLPRRSMTLWGLTLMAGAAAAAIALRFGSAVLWIFSAWPPLRLYLAVGIVVALAWSVGVCLGLPRSMDAGNRVRRPLRQIAILSQTLWIPASVFALLATMPALVGGTAGLARWADLLAVVAMLGTIAVGMTLSLVADELELDDAQKRIGLAIWVLPVLTIVLMFVPRGAGFIMISLTAPLLAWAWYLIGFVRGVWEFRQYVEWGMRQVSDVGDRAARIAATRTQLEREANAQVRTLPVPPHAPPTTPQPLREHRPRH